MNEQELTELLRKHDIPFHTWGTGETKTVERLLAEIRAGEARLEERDGKLVRLAEGGGMNVYYANGKKTLILREEKQVFKDGRERVRQLEASIGEKMRPGEDALAAAYRTLREELKIDEPLPLTLMNEIVKGPVPSQSYPGLLSHYRMRIYRVFLPEQHYKLEGYVEVQEEKTNYYVWDELE